MILCACDEGVMTMGVRKLIYHPFASTLTLMIFSKYVDMIVRVCDASHRSCACVDCLSSEYISFIPLCFLPQLPSFFSLSHHLLSLPSSLFILLSPFSVSLHRFFFSPFRFLPLFSLFASPHFHNPPLSPPSPPTNKAKQHVRSASATRSSSQENHRSNQRSRQ